MSQRSAMIMCLIIVLVSGSSLAQDHKPVKGKFYIPASERGTTTTESLEKAEVKEETSFIDTVKKEHRLDAWVNWWRTCDKSFSLEALVDAGVASITDEWQPFSKDEIAGPNGSFTVSGGGGTINPVWGRMWYVKEGNQWTPKVGPHCGVVMYKGDKKKRVVECGEFDGVFQAFGMGDKKLVVTAYRKMTPEMSSECHDNEVGQCVGAVLWLVDFKANSVWEYRGPVATYKRCEPNDLLVKLYPNFFIQEGEVVDAEGKLVKKK